MKNQAQLIVRRSHPWRNVSRFSTCSTHLFAGVFGGTHALPFFHPIDGADAGFDPIDHTQVDRRLGSWDDVAALAAGTDVMADVIVNHVSRHSPQFADYDQRGEGSPYAGMFLTYRRVFPDGARVGFTGLNNRARAFPSPPTRLREGTGFSCGPPSRAIKSTSTCRIPKRKGQLKAFSIVCTAPASRDSARCSRLRNQEGGHQLLHDSGDVRVHRRAHRTGARARHGGAGRSSRSLPESARREGLAGLVHDFALPPLVLHTLYTRSAAA